MHNDVWTGQRKYYLRLRESRRAVAERREQKDGDDGKDRCGNIPFREWPGYDMPHLATALGTLSLALLLFSPFPQIFAERPCDDLLPALDFVGGASNLTSAPRTVIPVLQRDVAKKAMASSLHSSP